MRNRLLAGILALALITGFSHLSRPSADVPASAAATDTVVLDAVPQFGDTTELDRLIDVFATRAPERQESLEYRTLGGLLLDRASLRSSIDDYAGASDAYAAALAISSADLESKLGAAKAALGTHDFLLARDFGLEVADADPSSVEALAVAGDAALAIGEFASARTSYEALMAALPSHPAVLLRMADLAAETGDGDLAADYVDRAIATAALDLGPDAVAPYEAYAANQAFLGGDYETALAHARRAVTADPSDAAAQSVLGDVLTAAGDLDGAVNAYGDALAIAPNPGDFIALGNIATVRADTAMAAQAYAEAEALITMSAESRRAHARTWANHLLDNGGDVAQALEIAVDELETRTDTAGWETYAWALFKNGRLAEAREAIDVALDRGLDAHGYYRAGAISAALGETDRAIEELTTALELSPRFHPIDATNAAGLLAELTG